MKIIFHKVRYQNFLSTGNQFTEIILDQNPLTVIIGKNGAGKSTLLDAISFCLFSKPFRKINKNQIINSITKKNCLVEIEFSIGSDNYKVIRGIKPNKFEIIKNNILIDQSSKSDDYQDYFEKNILRVNYKAFCQVVVLGKASYIPFMELPVPQRREIIENLLDLEIFSSMNVVAKRMNIENDSIIKTITNDIVLLKDRIKLENEYNLKKKSENENKIQIYNEELKTLKIEWDTLKLALPEEISSTDIVKEEIKNRNQDAREFISFRSKTEHQINLLKKEINFYNDHDKCPECKQNIDIKFRAEILIEKTAYLRKLEELLDESLQKEKLNENILSEHIDQLAEIKVINDKIFYTKQKLGEVSKRGKLIKGYIDDLKKETFEDSNNSENLESQLKKLQKTFDELILEKDKLTIFLRLLKDDGIKAKIILQYTDIINDLINNYLLEMDFICQFNLDENFNETIKSRYRDEFTYASFSEGEKMRINLAILFTWYEIAKRRNSINTNILFFDEILDGSLEVDGIEALLNIIKRLTDGNNCFIISHNDRSIDLIENVIKFEKKKGFSHIMDVSK